LVTYGRHLGCIQEKTGHLRKAQERVLSDSDLSTVVDLLE
jgi:hypothetical protein